MIDYKLIRSKRKTIVIYITNDAQVEVRAPLNVPKTEINQFVASQQDWIQNHLSDRKEALKKKAEFILTYGDTVTIRGKEYPVRAKDGGYAGFDEESLYVPPGLEPEDIKQAVIQVYRMVARNLFTRKVLDYAKQMNVKPAAVKITAAKSRWGSCSGRNNINFSWRLLMAEDEAIDYVVVHELAHIMEFNHSDRFWALVAAVLPDYKERQVKLDKLQKKLKNENWD